MADARNIALTLEANSAADSLMDRLRLSAKLDVVRIGLTYAMRHTLPLDREGWGRPGGSNYNVATIDTADGALRELVTIFYDNPDVLAAPYHAIETLMNRGLLLLKTHVDE